METMMPKVRQDLDLYAPLLESGGFLVLDGVSWQSVKPIDVALQQSMTCVFHHVEYPSDDYAIFWNSRWAIGAYFQRFVLNRFSRSI
jgi:hypothetical protein